MAHGPLKPPFSGEELDNVLRRAPERGFSFDDEWVVTRAEDGIVLGAVWLAPWWREGATEGTPVLGYRYGRHAWGRGYGGEAAAAVLAEAQRRGNTRVESSELPGNTASHRILLRLGFRPTFRRPLPDERPVSPSGTPGSAVWMTDPRVSVTGTKSSTSAPREQGRRHALSRNRICTHQLILLPRSAWAEHGR